MYFFSTSLRGQVRVTLMKFWWIFSNVQEASRVRQGGDLALGRSRAILWVTVLSLVIFVVWSYFAEIDEITRAPGTVVASSRTQLIQSQDGGVLEDLLVREGDTVEAGQLLARINRTRAEAAFLETRSQVAALSATIARVEAELFAQPPRYPEIVTDYPEFQENQERLLRVRQTAHQEEIQALLAMRALIEEELTLHQPLLAFGDVSRTEVLRLQRQSAEFAAQITNKRNQYVRDLQTELNRSREELAVLEQLLTQRRYLLQQTELRAPVRGILKNVRITTVGGVIRPGEDIMQIVPVEDTLLIEARVSPSDIAFLRIGMPVRIKIDAYDATIYGDLPGQLLFLSADTLSEDLAQGELPYYRARVQAEGRRFSGRPELELDIQPGMTALVEIQTGRRTVLQYLLKPIVKTLDQSLGER